MRIAQVAPLWETVPPAKYGGTQRVVHNLTEGLIKKGHEVTLFASGDSQTKAKLVSVYPRALYRDGVSWDNHLWPTLNYLEAFERAGDFDIIHCHIDRHTEYLALPLARYIKTPVVFTLHFILPSTPERADRRVFLEKFKTSNYISISKSQQKPMPNLNFLAVVYNGIPSAEIKFHDKPGSALVWLGRFSPTKGAREAIEIARRTKYNLILAGKLDTLDKEDLSYYKKYIEPEIDGKKIKYIGEIDAAGRNALFAQARVLLNPIQWDEPFGLVPVEAMAAGVPVITFKKGAMEELIEDGKTGFLVNDIDQAVLTIDKIDQIDRAYCRKHVEENFTIDKMVENYEKVYRSFTF